MPLAEFGVGIAAGILSGMFGIGGGMLTTPVIRALGHPALVAIGTPLPVIVPTAVAGAWSFARRGMADVRAGLTIGASGAAASVVGALASRAIGGRALLIVTAGIVVAVAVDTAVRGVRPASDRAEEQATPRVRVAGMALLGVVAGLYSGLLGLGGGFVVVPALSRLFGFPMKRAVGTSLVAISCLAIPGAITHWLIGNVDLPLAIALTAGVVPGALAGARLTQIASERWVRVGFACLMAAAGLWLGVSELLGP